MRALSELDTENPARDDRPLPAHLEAQLHEHDAAREGSLQVVGGDWGACALERRGRELIRRQVGTGAQQQPPSMPRARQQKLGEAAGVGVPPSGASLFPTLLESGGGPRATQGLVCLSERGGRGDLSGDAHLGRWFLIKGPLTCITTNLGTWWIHWHLETKPDRTPEGLLSPPARHRDPPHQFLPKTSH